jgi:3-oxoadipate enol-lactonase
MYFTLQLGDLAGAAELNVRTWVVGLRRTPDQVDPIVRQRIYEMQYHAFTVPIPEKAEELSLDPPAISRLAKIQVPTLLMVGEYDLQDKHETMKQLAVEIPQAQQFVIRDAAHIVNMEQPAEFNRIVLEFLKNCPI